MDYYCGWDGGGTKTEVFCMDKGGARVAGACFGPLNINGAARERVAETVRDCMAYMAALPGGLAACRGLTIGMAGASNIEAVNLITRLVRDYGYAGPLGVVGDSTIALEGAIRGMGAVLIAGTGAVCCGRDATGGNVSVGGYGYLIDDGGSGYAIGRDMLAATVRVEDGRCVGTCLADMVYEQLGISNTRQLVTWLYSPSRGKREVAALAPLLARALEAGDEEALNIAYRAADELAELAITAWRRMRLDAGELALTGSILNHFPAIRARVTELCKAACPNMEVIEPHGTPAQGAAMLARKLEQ